MNDINKTILIGRLTREAESNYTNSGLFVCKFSIAVNYSKKNGDNWEKEVSFFDVKSLGKRAEGLFQYLERGKHVCVEGELRQERWEKDGVKRSRVVINAYNIQLLGGNSENTESQNNTSPTPPAQKPQQNSLFTPPPSTSTPNADEFEDDLPF